MGGHQVEPPVLQEGSDWEGVGILQSQIVVPQTFGSHSLLPPRGLDPAELGVSVKVEDGCGPIREGPKGLVNLLTQ